MESLYKEKYQVGEIISYLRMMYVSVAEQERKLLDSLHDNISVESDQSIMYELHFDIFEYDKSLQLNVSRLVNENYDRLVRHTYPIRDIISPLSVIKSTGKKRAFYIILIEDGQIKFEVPEFHSFTFVKSIEVKDPDKFIKDYNTLMELRKHYLPMFNYKIDEEHQVYFLQQRVCMYHNTQNVSAGIAYYPGFDQIVGYHDRPIGRKKKGPTDLDLSKFLLTEIPADKIPEKYLDLITYMRIKGYESNIIDLCTNADMNIRRTRKPTLSKHKEETVVTHE